MRIETISKGLTSHLLASSNPASVFEAVFWQCAKQFPQTDYGLLDNPDLERQLKENIFPKDGSFSALRDQPDERCFDAEDQGQLELSGRYFALARLMAALDFYQGDRSTDDLGDAVYEAIMSTPDPSDTVQKINAVLSS